MEGDIAAQILDCYCGCFFHRSHYCDFHKNPRCGKSHWHWSKPNMAVFQITILVLKGTKRIECFLCVCVCVCTRVLKVVYSPVLIVCAQNALGKMARPIQMIPAHPPISLPPRPTSLSFCSCPLHTYTPSPKLKGHLVYGGVGDFEGRERRRRGRRKSAWGGTLSCPKGSEGGDGGCKETCMQDSGGLLS